MIAVYTNDTLLVITLITIYVPVALDYFILQNIVMACIKYDFYFKIYLFRFTIFISSVHFNKLLQPFSYSRIPVSTFKGDPTWLTRGGVTCRKYRKDPLKRKAFARLENDFYAQI